MTSSLDLGPVAFLQPIALLLIPLLVGASVWMARRSLSGLMGAARWAALGARILLIVLLAGVLAEPRWDEEGEDVAVTVVLDTSRSVPQPLQQEAASYFESAASRKDKPTDRVGLVSAAERALVQALPSSAPQPLVPQFVGETDGTDLASALQLALALRPEGAGRRIAIATDGNETMGSLLQAAQAAASAGVPIDVLPLRKDVAGEVIVDRVVVPAQIRKGQEFEVRPVLVATRATRGRLTVLRNGSPLDLDAAGEGVSAVVELEPGTNVLSVPVSDAPAGPQEFTAVFEPLDAAGDSVAENNRAGGVTFVTGEGRVLIVADRPQEAEPIERALAGTRIGVERVAGSSAPVSLTEMSGYDAIVMVNQPAYSYSEEQQENLRRYVHDAGGGLVMAGGPDSFGAGGWIGSPLEDALPVQLDPPSKRELPKGALALLIDVSGSMSSPIAGTSLTQSQAANEASIKAVEGLSRLDIVTVVAFDSGYRTVVPPQPAADKANIARLIRGMGPGGGTDMFPGANHTVELLAGTDAGVKHMIILSDGQTSEGAMQRQELIAKLNANKISVSTVTIGDMPNDPLMQELARATNGRYYPVRGANGMAQLTQIFFKEAQIVRRSLIWEGPPFSPVRTGVPSEPLRGFSGFPPIRGYVVAAPREGLALVTIRGKEEDPLLAQWQHGLGRVVAYTGDTTTRWSPSWVGWEGYDAFWEQHVRWAMRPTGSGDVRVVTETRGDRTQVIVEAFEPDGDRLPFASFAGRVSGPDGSGTDLPLRQVGPGRWEGSFASPDAGAYIVGLRYAAPPDETGNEVQGAVQAAVTRPFSDEFRVLEDNAALLEQVARMTNGRVLPEDPGQAELFDRTGVSFPVASTAIWVPLMLAALGLFLADVGVRRVRIDPVGMVRSVGARFAKARSHQAAEIGSLQVARAKARERIGPGAEDEAGAGAPPEVPATYAAAKFEAATGEPERSILSDPASPDRVRPEDVAAAEEGKKKPEAEGSMSALMRAKKRASDDYTQEG